MTAGRGYLQGLKGLVRGVSVDLMQSSSEPVTNVMRKLCEIKGLCD